MKLRGPLCVTGTAAEKHAKTVLTLLCAVGGSLLLSTTPMRTSGSGDYYIFLACFLEVAVLSLLRGLHPKWKSVPLFQYAFAVAVRTALTLNEEPPRGRLLFVAYCLLSGYLTIRAAVGAKLASNHESTKRRNEALCKMRLPLMELMALDLLYSLADLMWHLCSFDYGPATAFLARNAFYASMILVTMPHCVLINVKRILRIFLMLAVAWLSFAAIARLTEMISVPMVLLLSSIFAVDTLLIGTFVRNVLRPRGPRPIWSLDLTLEAALEHSLLAEYKQHLFVVTFYAKELAAIQRRLVELREATASLEAEGWYDARRHELLDEEAELLLDRLSDLCFRIGL